MTQHADTTTGEIVTVSYQHAKRWAERARLDLEGGADRIESGLSKIRTAIAEQHHLTLANEYSGLTEYIQEEYGGALAQIGQLLGVEARRAVVGELTEAGMSTRAIAPVIGASDWTVRQDQGARDLAPDPQTGEAGEAPESAPTTEDPASLETPEPAEEGEAEAGSGQTPEGGEAPTTPPPRPPVTGRDGKTYQRPEPKPAPEPDPSPQTKWSRRVQDVSSHIAMENLTDDQVREVQGAAEFLLNYCRGELKTRETK